MTKRQKVLTAQKRIEKAILKALKKTDLTLIEQRDAVHAVAMNISHELRKKRR